MFEVFIPPERRKRKAATQRYYGRKPKPLGILPKAQHLEFLQDIAYVRSMR